MYETCISTIDRQDLPTLREILLRFPLMLEICRALPEDAFMQIAARVAYATTTKAEGLPIEPRTLYLFPAPGRLYRRGREERTEKSIRVKSKGKTRLGREGVKQGQGRQIGEFGHLEESSGEQFYFPAAKNALVLLCEYEKMPESTATRIRELRAERLRFLHSLAMLEGVERGAVEEQLHGFSFVEMKFGAVRQPTNNGEVLIVRSGSVEVGAKGLQGRAVEGACVVGLDDDLQVKACSETVSCYTVRLQLLQALLARSKFTPDSSPFPCASAAVSPAKPDPPADKENRLDLSETLRAGTSLKKRANLRSMGQLSGMQKQRRLHLRRHFSNFYNQLFEQFSEKKARQLALGPTEEKLVLYEIKLLERKQPRMQEIHDRLRAIRLQKLKRCQAAIAGSPHLHQLTPGVGIE